MLSGNIFDFIFAFFFISVCMAMFMKYNRKK